MILTTTTSIEGRPVTEYLGIVTGEAILGANLFKDIFAGVRDIVGGRSGAYEKELRKAREIALQELQQTAAALRRTIREEVIMDHLERRHVTSAPTQPESRPSA